MKAVKKTKEKKRSEVEKVKEYKELYSTVYFVENRDIPSADTQVLRELIDGKILFVKKNIFQRIFPTCKYAENYFLVFANDKKPLEEFLYTDYAVKGDKVAQSIVIKQGVVKKEKLLEFLPNTVVEGSNRILAEDFTVCSEGDVLDENQAAILRILGYKLGLSKLNIIDEKPVSEIK